MKKKESIVVLEIKTGIMQLWNKKLKGQWEVTKCELDKSELIISQVLQIMNGRVKYLKVLCSLEIWMHKIF